jgi:hypothetical protein
VNQIVVVRARTPFSGATRILEDDFPPSSESGIVCH